MSGSKPKKSAKESARSGAPLEPVHQEPPIRVQDSPLWTRSLVPGPGGRWYWPKGVAPPRIYRKLARPPVPCENCGCVRDGNGAQACLCTGSPRPDPQGRLTAWFRCRVCDARFSKFIEIVGTATAGK